MNKARDSDHCKSLQAVLALFTSAVWTEIKNSVTWERTCMPTLDFTKYYLKLTQKSLVQKPVCVNCRINLCVKVPTFCVVVVSDKERGERGMIEGKRCL